MGKVSINVNGRAFAIGCEDGQEQAVAALGEQFSKHVTELAGQVGQIGDLRLFLMAALVLGDKLRESEKASEAAKTRIAALEADGAEDQRAGEKTIKAAAKALNQAAKRVETLAKQLGTEANR